MSHTTLTTRGAAGGVAPGGEPPTHEPAAHLRWPAVLVSLVSLVAVVVWISDQPAPRLPESRGELIAVLAAVVLYGVATILRGERWFWMLNRAGAQTTRTDAYSLTTIGYMGNNVLPVRGGDVIRTYLAVQRCLIGYRAVIGTLIAERVLDVVFLLSTFTLLAVVVLPQSEIPDLDLSWPVLAAAGFALAAIALALSARRHRLIKRFLDFLRPMAKATRDLRGSYGAGVGMLTIAIWFVEAATYFAVGGAVGLQMTPIDALYLIALVSVFILIPSGPGYLGPLDAAVLFGVRAIGGSGTEAVSYLLMLRFVLFVPITLAGLILLVVRYGGLASLRPGGQADGSPA